MEVMEHAQLTHLANEIRKKLIRAIHHVQTGHPGSSLSTVEILTTLYFKYLRYDTNNPHSAERDYFILSKGHGAPALYATLAQAGFLPEEELFTLRQLHSRLQGHPNAAMLPGVDVSTGSLGQGLSIGIGLALGFQLDRKPNRVYCVLGDGELQEGQNWEAAMIAPALHLNHLTAIIDRNQLQNDGPTESIVPIDSLQAKWEAFGWNVHVIDGHDFDQLDDALQDALRQTERPTMIVANTIKGKGISFMENQVHWHHHPINDEQFAQAMAELGEVNR